MPRKAREVSESGIYHACARGVNRMAIFHDDQDRRKYLDLLEAALNLEGVDLLAYCLMPNHVHLLLQAEPEGLAEVMHRSQGRYARFHNWRHGHVGHLFQDRFSSKPVATTEHLLLATRYVHSNPLAARIASDYGYPWSSYREYVGEPRLCNTTPVLEAFGSQGQFEDFHAHWMDTNPPKQGVHEESLGHELAFSVYDRNLAVAGLRDPEGLKSLGEISKVERNTVLRELKGVGLSVREISRLTGIGRNIIQRA